MTDHRKIAVATFATRRYAYALRACLRRIAAAVREPAYLIVAHDGSSEIKSIIEASRDSFMHNFELIHAAIDVDDNVKNYSVEAQELIARLQQEAFTAARNLPVEWCWSVESDVLVPSDGFTFSRAQIEAFAGYYDIAMVTYPNGDFLGGHGTPQQSILPSVYDDERELPESLPEDEQEKRKVIEDAKPKGNVWELNGKGWRRRGWLTWAYPGIGRGAVLPTDWVGLGCTLMNRKALDLAMFDGYDGRGTQDLFLTWKRWHPAGLRACVITHTLASHVTRKRNEDGTQDFGDLTLYEASHVTEGEFIGHLRITAIPWKPSIC